MSSNVYYIFGNNLAFCRRHRGVDLESATFTPLSEDQPSHSRESLSQHFTEAFHVETSPSPAPSNEPDRLQRSAALFLLTLKEKYEITQSALNFAVGQVQQMVAFAVEDTRISMKEHLFPHLQAADISVEVMDNFDVPDPFDILQTEHMQTKYYKEYFDLVVS